MALAFGAGAACQPTAPDPVLKQSRSADTLPILNGSVLEKLGQGAYGIAYKVEIDGKVLVFKSVSDAIDGAAANPSAVTTAMTHVTPEEFGGIPGAATAYPGIMNIEGAPKAGVVMPYFDGVSLDEATRVTPVQIAKIRGDFANAAARGYFSDDGHLGNILVGNDGESTAEIDQRFSTSRAYLAFEDNIYAPMREARLGYWEAVNAATGGNGPPPPPVSQLTTERLSGMLPELAETIAADAAPVAATNAQLIREAIVEFIKDESTIPVGEASAAGFATFGVAVIAQLGVLNVLNPPGKPLIWSEIQLFENIAYDIAKGLCASNPASPLCPGASINLRKVALTNGSGVWFAWQYDDKNDTTVSIDERGVYSVYEKGTGVLRGTLLNDGGVPLYFAARPCTTTNGLYAVTITQTDGSKLLRNATVTGNVLTLVDGDGTCGERCSAEGEACGAGCCNGLACEGNRCQTPACASDGERCEVDEDCCGASVCDDLVCTLIPQCSSTNQSCVNDRDCCDGLVCDDYVCLAGGGDSCSEDFAQCAVGDDCCSGTCADGMCESLLVANGKGCPPCQVGLPPSCTPVPNGSASSPTWCANNTMTCQAGVCAEPFTDVAPGSMYHDFIVDLLRRGITAGTGFDPASGKRTFDPEGGHTRDQAAVFIVRARNLSHPDPQHGLLGGSPDNFLCRNVYGIYENCAAPDVPAPFGDVPKSYWAYAWIQKLVELGITKGCATGFCPGAALELYDTTIFAARGEYACNSDYACDSAVPYPAAPLYYSDMTDPKSPYFPFVQNSAAQGRWCGKQDGSGYAYGRYGLNDPITRRQAAAFIARSFFGGAPCHAPEW